MTDMDQVGQLTNEDRDGPAMSIDYTATTYFIEASTPMLQYS